MRVETCVGGGGDHLGVDWQQRVSARHGGSTLAAVPRQCQWRRYGRWRREARNGDDEVGQAPASDRSELGNALVVGGGRGAEDCGSSSHEGGAECSRRRGICTWRKDRRDYIDV